MKNLIILLLALSALVSTAELSVQQIVEKANFASYYAGKDGKATVTMTINDKNGQKRIREFVILRKDEKDAGNQKFYVYFKKPFDVRKMAYLVWKHVAIDDDDDRWLWLPDLNLKKRIAPGDKRSSFVGSHFLYEDVSGRNLSEDKHELIETTQTHYLIKNTPVNPNEVEFSYYNIWINKENFLPQKAIYFKKETKKKYRMVEVLEIKDIQGFPTVVKSKASDLETGGFTINTFSDVKYNINLKERIFTERFLRRPPREVR
ncbi:MAG: outer membrane lipoprotein-sorting protein [Verrucomicrobiota bacterium]|nr:outer membrane lipoprotein-sorting protein [Verrucomicrobiota bacterium]